MKDKETVKDLKVDTSQTTGSVNMDLTTALSNTTSVDLSPTTNLETVAQTDTDSKISNNSTTDTTTPAIGNGESEAKPVKRKRLTLQERLALAAKGKKKTTSDGETELALALTTNLADTGNESETGRALAETLVVNLTVPSRSLTPVPDDGLALATLRAQNKQLALELEKLKSSGLQKTLEQQQHTIEQQEQTISELRHEGEVLSKRELKLNETVKKLKLTNAALEDRVQTLDTSVSDNSEVEAHLKQRGFSSMAAFVEKYDLLATEVEDLLQWKAKYTELRRLYEEEVEEKRAALRDLADLKILFDVAKRQHALEIEGKSTAVSELRRELQQCKLDGVNEILRLEAKVEQLRADREVTNIETGSSEISNAYAQLSDTHHQLHQQHLSSQESWKMIEANMLAKIDLLTQSVEQLKKSRAKLAEEVKARGDAVRVKDEEMTRIDGELAAALQSQQDTAVELKVKETELSDLRERFEKIKSVYDVERNNLKAKIEELERRCAEVERTEALAERVEHAERAERQLSMEGLWNEFGLGDSPAMGSSAQFSPQFDTFKSGPSHQNSVSVDPSSVHRSSASSGVSSVGVGEIGASEPRQWSRGHVSNELFGPATITNQPHSNVQLINKMGANIQRLETEMNTLREEKAEIVAEKEQIEQQLLARLRDDEMANVRAELEEVRRELEEKEAAELRMLELIGEKLEQVEELRADIVDLKDLCKLQVQQMIEMQEKFGST